jgi:hypothetical protein
MKQFSCLLWVSLVALALYFTFSCDAYAAKKKKAPPPNEFIAGYDHARTLLSKGKPRGKNFRKRLVRIVTLYKDYCETYMPDHVPECLIRILVESDGHEGTHTKDTTAREAGATSIGYAQAVTLCEEYGVCGDPCWDREFAAGAFAWLLYHDRKTFLEQKWWRDWLPDFCEEARSECELIIALALDVNTGKVEKVMKKSGAKKIKHPWWGTIKWFKGQTDLGLAKMLSPMAVDLRRFGIRWGFILQKQKIRVEWYDGKAAWGPLVEEPPAKPPAKNPLPSEKEWRKTCHLHKTKQWYLTHPTMSKKNKKKYIKKMKGKS